MPADEKSPLDADALFEEIRAERRAEAARDEPAPERDPALPVLPDGLPDPLTLDVQSTRESIFSGLAILGIAIAFILFSLGTGHYSKYSHRYNPPAWPEALGYIPFPLAGAALLFAARKSTDDHHRLFLRAGRLDYRASFLGRTFDRTVCRRGEIERVVMTEQRKSNKHSHWIEYTLYLIDRRGHRILAAGANRDRDEAGRNGRALAAALGAPFAG